MTRTNKCNSSWAVRPLSQCMLHVLPFWRRTENRRWCQFDFWFFLWRGHQTLTTQAVNFPFFGMSQARRTLISPNSYSSMLPISLWLHVWCLAEHIGYSFLFEVFLDGLGTRSILQPVYQNVYFGYPSLILVDNVLWNSMNLELDLKRVLLSQ